MDDLEKLIIKSQSGDNQAFGQIYQLFYKRIYRFCRVHLYDEETASDLCQETFVKAWKALPSFSFKAGGSFQAFLFRIARNLIIDLSRKKKVSSLEQVEEPATNEDLLGQIDEKETQEKLHQALDKLGDKDKNLIVLRFFEDLSFIEVAKAMGEKEGALRVRTHRALKKLKEILQQA